MRRAATKRGSRGPVKALTTEEAQAFVRVAAETEAAAWPALALMMLAGLRAGEAFAVTADRLDLRAGRLVVDRQLTQFGGLRVTKAGESRTVELAPQLMELLGGLAAGPARERVVGLDGAPLGATKPPGPYLVHRRCRSVRPGCRRCRSTAGPSTPCGER